jgi:chromosome segregation and condensation protein ScpB
MQPKKAVLTDVMMETLSIIAYKQPVTKQEIDKIRGLSYYIFRCMTTRFPCCL